MTRRPLRILLAAVWSLGVVLRVGWSEVLRFPTANHTLLTNGGEAFFVGTIGKPWTTGTFGCVRSDGWQMHEGLDIRCLSRDKDGEPCDPILSAAAGTVAYASTNVSLSTYGRYIILRHQIEGLEVYTLYAHLSKVRTDLTMGRSVKAGEQLGVMGRTSNTGQRISKERAHVHFEVDLLINERFAAWFRESSPGQRNDHGQWNGHNLIGLDPAALFLEQARQGAAFSLLRHVRAQKELCRVVVRKASFPWVRRYPGLTVANPKAEKEGIAGYELALNFNGLPFQAIPRAASEIQIKGKARYQLLSVQAPVQAECPCRRIVTHKAGKWELHPRGTRLLDLLTF